MNRYQELSPFSLAFAAAYRGFMKEVDVTGKQIAAKLGRNIGYVSERVNGKRALDTEDVDALAMLAGDGWSGKTLLLELARRARETTLPKLVDQRGEASGVGGDPEDGIPHVGKVDLEHLRQSGVALAADERDGIEEEQEQSQELP